MGDTVLDTFTSDLPLMNVRNKEGKRVETKALETLVTLDPKGSLVMALVNKDPANTHNLRLAWPKAPHRYNI